MPFTLPLYGVKGYGKLTQTAGTVIVRLVEPMLNAYTILSYVEVSVGATAHTLTILRPLGKTTFSAAAAASQAVVNITADPGDYSSKRTADNVIAANDYVVYRAADGTFVVDTVSSVSSLAITLATNLPTLGVTAGDPIWFYGITTDTNPSDAIAHPQFSLGASSVVTFGDKAGEGIAGFCGSFGKYEPLLLYVNNATNASIIERVTALYSSKGSPTTSNAA